MAMTLAIVSGMTACGSAGKQEEISESSTAVESESSSEDTEETDAEESSETIEREEDEIMEESIETVEPEESLESAASVLVVYFSRTGHTRPLAEYAADYFEADLYEIEAKDPYTDEDIDYGNSDSRTSKEQNDPSVRPEIEGNVDNMDQYDTIVLAYPIWWGQAPRIIDTFLESYDFTGKTILPLCTSASSDIGSSDEDLYGLVSDTVTWIKGKRFAIGTDEATFTAWLDEVMK